MFFARMRDRCDSKDALRFLECLAIKGGKLKAIRFFGGERGVPWNKYQAASQEVKIHRSKMCLCVSVEKRPIENGSVRP